MLVLFFIGIIEMIIVSIWTKIVSENKVLASGVVTVVNIMIWYYVLASVVENINNFWLIIVYALGCAIGTMLTTAYFNKTNKKRKKAVKLSLREGWKLLRQEIYD
ncbi:MAG: DUF5698 domain-containing protein [Patescibacteria group bacterium]|jgi:tryptophan-rich sensory protein